MEAETPVTPEPSPAAEKPSAPAPILHSTLLANLRPLSKKELEAP